MQSVQHIKSQDKCKTPAIAVRVELPVLHGGRELRKIARLPPGTTTPQDRGQSTAMQ